MTRAAYPILCLLAGTLLAGCSSIQPPYIPRTVGDVGPRYEEGDLAVHIAARSNSTEVGKPIVFDITLRNIGEDAFWVPKDPQVCFHFIYANGTRDNYLNDPIDSQYYGEEDAVHLGPGQTMSKSFEVKTYYFERTGITEFYAVVNLAQNTNPAVTPWRNGRLESNSYGVLVAPPDRRLGQFLLGQLGQAASPST